MLLVKNPQHLSNQADIQAILCIYLPKVWPSFKMMGQKLLISHKLYSEMPASNFMSHPLDIFGALPTYHLDLGTRFMGPIEHRTLKFSSP